MSQFLCATAQAWHIPLAFSARAGARIGAGRPRKKNGRVSHLARPKFGPASS
jgi:hypothetical protein